MTNTTELDRLIALNIADLDTTATRVEALGEKIWKQLSDLVEQWTADQGWFGAFSGDDVWLAPAVWRLEDDKEALGWFYFDVGPGDTQSNLPGEPNFWLTRLLGENNGEFCLWLGQNAAGVKVWKGKAREAATDLAAAGVNMSDACNFFIRCSLDKTAVAQGLADGDLDDALEPIRIALERAKAALPHFQDLLDKAQNS